MRMGGNSVVHFPIERLLVRSAASAKGLPTTTLTKRMFLVSESTCRQAKVNTKQETSMQ